MKLLIFSIRDSKAEFYHRPILQLSIGEAIRTLTDEVNNPQSVIARHPEDFHLFRLGVFDQDTGKILPEEPIHITCAVDLVASGPADAEVEHQLRAIGGE